MAYRRHISAQEKVDLRKAIDDYYELSSCPSMAGSEYAAKYHLKRIHENIMALHFDEPYNSDSYEEEEEEEEEGEYADGDEYCENDDDGEYGEDEEDSEPLFPGLVQEEPVQAANRKKRNKSHIRRNHKGGVLVQIKPSGYTSRVNSSKLLTGKQARGCCIHLVGGTRLNCTITKQRRANVRKLHEDTLGPDGIHCKYHVKNWKAIGKRNAGIA